MDMVRLEHVVKVYDNGRRALNDVNFNVNKHESNCICGAFGSAKTMLLKLIAGMEAPSDGNIYVDGKEVHSMDSNTAATFRNHTFGILLRDHGFMNNLTVLENVTLPFVVRKLPTRARNQSAIEHMKTLGIAHLARAYPRQLSIMELQLASLARALTGEPKILLIDEMGADLTKREQEKMDGLLYTAWKSHELTLIHLTDKKNVNWSYDRYFSLEYGMITEVTK